MNDNQLLNITEKDVAEYRDLYYDIIKPLMETLSKEKVSEKIFKDTIDKAITDFGWTSGKFKLFQGIDLRQRFSRWDLGPKVGFIGGIDSITASQVPELRCPIRSSDK